MGITKGMFTSNSCEWSTPQLLFDILNAEFNFNTDVCATQYDAKCKHFYSPEDDGLSKTWTGTCFMNPPYGREIIKWVKKASSECRKNKSTIVCIVPSRTDTKWMHEYCSEADEIRLIKGRLHFNDGPNAAPFPSCIVIFKPDRTRDEPYIHFWEIPKTLDEV